MVHASHLLTPLLAVIAAVFAAPALGEGLEERAPSKCVTHAEGYLATALLKDSKGSLTSHWKPFAFNGNGELAYFNGGGKPIWVQFQTCTPNYAGGTNKVTSNIPSETVYWGRVYLPAYKQCLAVENSGKTGPYFIHRAACLNSASGEMTTKKSIPQSFSFRTFTNDESRKIIFWTGATKDKGGSFQAGCPGGFFGYQLRPNNEPVTYSGSKVKAVCDADTRVAAIFAELRRKPSN